MYGATRLLIPSLSRDNFPFSALQIGISKMKENCFDLPASSADHGKNIAAYYF